MITLRKWSIVICIRGEKKLLLIKFYVILITNSIFDYDGYLASSCIDFNQK